MVSHVARCALFRVNYYNLVWYIMLRITCKVHNYNNCMCAIDIDMQRNITCIKYYSTGLVLFHFIVIIVVVFAVIIVVVCMFYAIEGLFQCVAVFI